MAAHKRIISTALRQRNEALQKAQNARNEVQRAKVMAESEARQYRKLERIATYWYNTAIKYRVGCAVAVLALVLVVVFK